MGVIRGATGPYHVPGKRDSDAGGSRWHVRTPKRGSPRHRARRKRTRPGDRITIGYRGGWGQRKRTGAARLRGGHIRNERVWGGGERRMRGRGEVRPGWRGGTHVKVGGNEQLCFSAGTTQRVWRCVCPGRSPAAPLGLEQRSRTRMRMRRAAGLGGASGGGMTGTGAVRGVLLQACR
jgi:hypothetical protein